VVLKEEGQIETFLKIKRDRCRLQEMISQSINKISTNMPIIEIIKKSVPITETIKTINMDKVTTNPTAHASLENNFHNNSLDSYII